MKIVDQDLWFGMSSAGNGAKSFARIMLDFVGSAANFCCQVSALVQDLFYNFFSKKIAKLLTEAPKRKKAQVFKILKILENI